MASFGRTQHYQLNWLYQFVLKVLIGIQKLF